MSQQSTKQTTAVQEPEGASEKAVEGAKGALERWKRTRIARGLARYGAVNGALLTGGVTYSALFSVFAAVVVAFAIFMMTLGGNEELRQAVIDGAASAGGNLIDDGSGSGLITVDQLNDRIDSIIDASLIPAIVGAAGLIWTATSVMSSLRISIRAVFGVQMPKENIVVGKLRDLLGFLALALAVVLTSALGIAVGTAGRAVTDAIGLDGNPVASFFLRVAGHVVALAVDVVVVMVLVRGLGGVRAPRKDLFLGAFVVGVAAGVIRYLGPTVVTSVSDDPLLASFAAIIVLLLWINLLTRVLLMVCAWTSNPPLVPVVASVEEVHAAQTPNYVTQSEPATLDWDHDPATGRIRPEEPEPDKPVYWGGAAGWATRKYRGFRDA